MTALLQRFSTLGTISLLAGCAGYNLQLGTGSDATSPGYYEVVEKPATSVEAPLERSASQPLPPPPSEAPADATQSKRSSNSAKPEPGATQ